MINGDDGMKKTGKDEIKIAVTAVEAKMERRRTLEKGRRRQNCGRRPLGLRADDKIISNAFFKYRVDAK